jgi:hypothetical protein
MRVIRDSLLMVAVLLLPVTGFRSDDLQLVDSALSTKLHLVARITINYATGTLTRPSIIAMP